MACPHSYPFPRLPQISFQSYEPTSLSASTCFASLTSLPSFLAALGRSLGGLYLSFSASDPPTTGRLGELHEKFPEHYESTTPSSASQSVTSSVYHNPASAPLFVSPLLMLLTISRLRLYGMHSSRRVLTCRMTCGPLHLLTIWLDTAEMLRFIPLTLA
jgi:hypothetical protein